MLIVLFVVFVLLTFVAIISCDELVPYPASALLLVIIAALVIGGYVVNGRVIDAKIEMYSEENASIEESIDDLVNEYMSFESDTFTGLKTDDTMALVSLYPELKSDELVKAQIDVYRANNEKIKKLKESKLNLSALKWWLYFGS